MAKIKEKDEKSVMVGVIWNCADIKFLLGSLLTLGLFATLFQLFPYKSILLSSTDLRSCLSSKLSAANSQTPPPLPSDPHPLMKEEFRNSDNTVLKRAFNPIGTAAHLFVQMGAYRGGAATFAVVGLASKPLHVFGNPTFACEWISNNASAGNLTAKSYKMLPDWGYGRVYTVVVVNCTFPSAAAADGAGGRLLIRAASGVVGEADQTFVALEESPGSVNLTAFSSPPRYDYLYCGSSLYGDLSPQRVREWLAYHVKFFGERAHFVIHDAGGVHKEVYEVLKPWIEKGVVTLQDIRDQEKFDGYYHNQFLVVNDCLHRYRFTAKWMFFFDVDEFIYVPPGNTVGSVLDSFSRFTQFSIEQMPMSSKLCSSKDANETSKLWGIEKLVYKDVKRGVRKNRKYAIQPRNAFSAGVHLSQNFAGKSLHKTEGQIMYFHYHGTIASRKEPCREFVNVTAVTAEGTPYVVDETLRRVAGSVRKFELDAIGPRLLNTRQ